MFRASVGGQNIGIKPLVGVGPWKLKAGFALAANAIHQACILRSVDQSLGRRSIVQCGEVAPKRYIAWMMDVVIAIVWFEHVGFKIV